MTTPSQDDPTALYRDLLAAIRDALDIPRPGPGETDRQAFWDLRRDRLATVLGTIDSVIDHDLTLKIVTQTLRDRVAQSPVTYRRYIAAAKDNPADCQVCGPGCCSPVLGIHSGAARPEGGNFRLPPPQPQVAPASTSRETADVQ